MNKLVVSAVLGPLAWIAQFAIDWTLAFPVCRDERIWLLLAVNLAAAVIAAWCAWSVAPLRASEPFQASLVAGMNAGLVVVIIAQSMPILLLRGCA